jgi:hypothetical protein
MNIITITSLSSIQQANAKAQLTHVFEVGADLLQYNKTLRAQLVAPLFRKLARVDCILQLALQQL